MILPGLYGSGLVRDAHWAAGRESQYVNIFRISLYVFSTSIEICYVYCLLYLPLSEAKILKLREFNAKGKCTVKQQLTVSYLLFYYPRVFLQLENG